MTVLIIFIVFCFLFFLDVIMKGFLHKLIINFISVILIFIYDLIKLDRTVFRGYGFWAYCGLGGSGKTLSIVDYLIKVRNKFPHVKILTNFSCAVADGKIKDWHDLLDIQNINTYTITKQEYEKRVKWGQKNIFMVLDSNNTIVYKKTVNDGVIYGFDEIHLTFESTKWQDAPSNLLDYISQQRKYHKQIVSSSQVFTRIDKKLREQTNYVIECRSIFMGRLIFNSIYKTTEYIANGDKMDKGTRKRKCYKRDCFIAFDNIRDKYNTEEIMKDLQGTKSKERVLVDLIKDLGGINNG